VGEKRMAEKNRQIKFRNNLQKGLKMKKYTLFTKLISYLNNPFTTSIFIPLFIAITISLSQIFWNLDFSAKKYFTGSMKTSTAKNIVVLTVNSEDISKNGDYSGEWRKYHAEVINKLADAGAAKVGFDIVFYSSITKWDSLLISSINYANTKKTEITLAADGDSLDYNHWVYQLVQDKKINLGAGFANVFENDFAKSYILKDKIRVITASGEIEKDIPSLALAISYKEPDLSQFPREEKIKYPKESFPLYHYGNILDDNEFSKIKDKFAGKTVLIGVESENDLIKMEYIPQGQPSVNNETTYGVFYNACALNYLINRDKMIEIEGFAKFTGILLICLLISLVYNFIYKKKFLLKAALIFGIIISINGVLLLLGYIYPVYSFNLSFLAMSIIVLLPEILITLKTAKLTKYQKQYTFTNKEIFNENISALKIPQKSLHDITGLVSLLNLIFVESEGHTFFEEIDYQILEKIGLLDANYELSKKRINCIGRADYVIEDFCGTRIRRMRNLFSHANLKEHIVKLAEDAIKHYSGKNYLEATSQDIYLWQTGLLDEITEYLININNYN